MADLPKDNESTLNPQRSEETHKPARGAAGGRHVADGATAEERARMDAQAGLADRPVDRAAERDGGDDSQKDGRRDPTREASGDALRRQMANPVIPSVTTMVCVTCGAEQFFDGAVPRGLKCQRCSSMVFRTFETPTRRDEATIAHLEEEARSMAYGDESPQTTPEDVRDLRMSD
jgi:DNA-directed RNA polymerase subunit RPC12/RpoP